MSLYKWVKCWLNCFDYHPDFITQNIFIEIKELNNLPLFLPPAEMIQSNGSAAVLHINTNIHSVKLTVRYKLYINNNNNNNNNNNLMHMENWVIIHHR